MSMADALKKAGVISEDKLKQHTEKVQQKNQLNEQLQAYGARDFVFKRALGDMENIPTPFFGADATQIAETLGKFAQQFKDHPQVRRSIDFHLKKIQEKQKWKLEMSFSQLLGDSLAAAVLDIKSKHDMNLVWAIRATGYALCDVMTANDRYSPKTKQEVLDWLKPNAAALSLI